MWWAQEAKVFYKKIKAQKVKSVRTNKNREFQGWQRTSGQIRADQGALIFQGSVATYTR